MGFVTPDRDYRQKLLRMGLVRGAMLTVIRKAPLGDPVEIELHGYKLMLRQAEADAVEVELVVAASVCRRRWRFGWRRHGGCARSGVVPIKADGQPA